MAIQDKGKQVATPGRAFNSDNTASDSPELMRTMTTLGSMVEQAHRDSESGDRHGRDDEAPRGETLGYQPGYMPWKEDDNKQRLRKRNQQLAEQLSADFTMAARLLDKYLLSNGQRRRTDDDGGPILMTRRFYKALIVDMERIADAIHAYRDPYGPLAGVGALQRYRARNLLGVLLRRLAHGRAAWGLEDPAAHITPHEFLPSPLTAVAGPSTPITQLQQAEAAGPRRPSSATPSGKSSASSRLKGKLKDKFRKVGRALSGFNDAIKGKGKGKGTTSSMYYYNPGSAGTARSSSSSESSDGEGWVPPELPPDIAVYQDERETAFVGSALQGLQNELDSDSDSDSGSDKFMSSVLELITGFLEILAD